MELTIILIGRARVKRRNDVADAKCIVLTCRGLFTKSSVSIKDGDSSTTGQEFKDSKI